MDHKSDGGLFLLENHTVGAENSIDSVLWQS